MTRSSTAADNGSRSREKLRLSRGDLIFSAMTRGWEENTGGPVVLCLHGFPDDANTFRLQAPVFAAAGYRVIAPTLRGYEPSSQPQDDDYGLATLARDVLSWIDALGEKGVHLLGHDWGAAIAYVAGALAPERFLSLATIAVPHVARLPAAIRKLPVQLLKSWYMTFFQLPAIAEYAVERDDWALIRWCWKTWSPGLEMSAERWEELRATFSRPGVTKAMLSYYRQNASPMIMLGITQTEAMRLSTVSVPTLAITGAQDRCIDTRLYDHVFPAGDFPRGVRVARIDDAGHFAHLEQPDRVNALLLDWWSDIGDSSRN